VYTLETFNPAPTLEKPVPGADVESMATENISILDKLLSSHTFSCQIQPTSIKPDDIVHVVGSQEPVRNQPDDRARTLFAVGWLKIEHVRTTVSEPRRAAMVTAIQQAAQNWLKLPEKPAEPADHQQAHWLVEKTRSHESSQQIIQRIWLALVLYNLGYRSLHFNEDGQVSWDQGMTGRIGISPDAMIDLAWEQANHVTFSASFRRPDGSITRGKGRQRWHIYRFALDPATGALFERRRQPVAEKVALIVASETFATQPQLPRDFYGGDAFQQACIDAQDQHFSHILVLSPEHGVVSLDDTVRSEQLWQSILEHRIWSWQIMAAQRLGRYLFGELPVSISAAADINWWVWLNPKSTYEISVFGSGFGIRFLFDQLFRLQTRLSDNLPKIILSEHKPGYDIGDFDDDYDFGLDEPFLGEEPRFQDELQDIDHLLELSAEFVSLISISIPSTSETLTLAPDEAILPVRILSNLGMDAEELLDLLTDISLLLEKPIPINMLINAGMVVSVLLQIAHNLVHNELETVRDLLVPLPEAVLRQYIENTLREEHLEDQLCACLTLAEQIQLIALAIPPAISEQLLIWLQTYLTAQMRQRILGNMDTELPT
jgi:hypothetical protein